MFNYTYFVEYSIDNIEQLEIVGTFSTTSHLVTFLFILIVFIEK